MKKKVFKERYYKDIEHDGANFGKSKIIEGKTVVIDNKIAEKKTGIKLINRTKKTVKKEDK